jgi:hypothetical protein
MHLNGGKQMSHYSDSDDRFLPCMWSSERNLLAESKADTILISKRIWQECAQGDKNIHTLHDMERRRVLRNSRRQGMLARRQDGSLISLIP